MAQNVDIELVIKAGQSAQTLGEIKQSIKDVTQALKDTKQGTEEFNRLVEVFQRNRANVKALRQEFADLKQVEVVGKILTGSFASATASMSLFTGESEKAEKAIRKVEAAFVLMESVQKVARAFREAAIANETFNKSLMTNPYMLVATAIAGIALAIYTYTNDTEAAAEATKKLNETSLKSLQDSLKEMGDEQEEINKELQHNIDLLKEKKATEGEIYAATKKQLDAQKKGIEEQLASFNDYQKEQMGDYEKQLPRIKELKDAIAEEGTIHKQNNELKDKGFQYDKDALATSEKRIKEDQEELDNVEKKVEAGKKIFEQQEQLLQKLKEIKRVDETADTSHVEADKEEHLKEAHEAELERIKAVKKALEDIERTDENNIELAKAYDATEKKLSDDKIIYLKKELDEGKKILDNENKKIQATEKLLSKQLKGSEDYKATLENLKAEKEFRDELNKSLDTKNQKLETEQILNKKLGNEEVQTKQLKNIEDIDKAYEKQAAALKNITDVMKAKGDNDADMDKRTIQNNLVLINSLNQEITVVQASIIKDDEKAKKIDELKKKVQELTDANNVLSGAMKKIDEQSVFGKYTKEVKEALSSTEKIVPIVNKVMSLATQIVSQNVQARIALYQHENDMYVAGLNNALNEGFISQQQYNKKVAAAQAELKKQKQQEEHKEFVAKKATGIIDATIKTALAVMQALSSSPPPASYALAAVAGALGAVEIATIAAQKEPPAYAVGGSVDGIGTSTSDSILARVSNGESIMNAKSTKMFAPLLSAINQIGGGVALKGTQAVQKSPSGLVSSSSQPQASSAPQKVYVVESDITRTQNKVAVIQKRSSF